MIIQLVKSLTAQPHILLYSEVNKVLFFRHSVLKTMKHSIIPHHLYCVGCVGEYSLKTSYTNSEVFQKYQKHTLFIFTRLSSVRHHSGFECVGAHF